MNINIQTYKHTNNHCMIFFSSNHSGQLLKGYKSSLSFLQKHVSLRVIPPEPNLTQNLYAIYSHNSQYKKPRVNFLGDHSSTIATGAWSLKHNPRCKFIWIDAHPDINTYDASSTKNFHGMPLAYLTGLNTPYYPMPFPFIFNNLPFQNILYIGIRSIDTFEQNIIDKEQIQVIDTFECNNNIQSVLHKIHNFIENDPVHISFDVDALDPSIMPSTGTPVENGLKKDAAIKILQFILSHSHVYNFDISELNLEIGDEQQKEISKQTIVDILRGTRIIV